MKEGPSLNKENFKKAREIFLKAIEMGSEDSQSFVLEACEGDQQLLDSLQKMLKTHKDEEDFTINAKQPDLSKIFSAKEIESGVAFGKYKVIKLLSVGGMGEVYLAERKDQEIEQKVALKVLRNAHLDAVALSRFHLERRVLSGFEHSGIARLIDAGEAEGIPYYAMEYIEAESIDAYCQRKQCSIQQRLALFIQVCEAVNHAHSHLIIHRDIKPSNILVNAEGIVKLIDFGIAKPLDHSSAYLSQDKTLAGMTPLTPKYASPEQFKGEEIGIACDIYALGLLLYFLLTGSDAQQINEKSWAEIEAIICEKMPRLPSKRILEAPAEPSNYQLISLSKHARLLSGDLDSIIMKALRKEPIHRYGSVLDLKRDIESHLQGKPISVRGNQHGYRIKKFLLRHWLVTSAFALATITLFVSSVIILIQSQQVKEERDHALQEQKISEQVTNFLLNTFTAADPAYKPGDVMSAEELLDNGVVALQQNDLSERVKQKLLLSMGEAYFHLSSFDKSIEILNQVESQSDEQVKAMANFLKARTEFSSGQPVDALALVEKGLLLDSGDVLRVSLLQLKAMLLRSTSKNNEAKEVALEAYTMATSVFSKESIERVDSMLAYGQVLNSADNYSEVLQIYLDALELLTTHHSKKEARIADVNGKVARMYYRLRDYPKALEYADTSFIKLKHIYGDMHARLSPIVLLLGTIHTKLGQFDVAVEEYAYLIRITEQTQGKNTYDIARANFNIGILKLRDLKQPKESLPYFEKALDIVGALEERVYYFHNMQLIYSVNLIQLGEANKAQEKIESSLAYYLDIPTKTGLNIALAQSCLALAFEQLNKKDEALALLQETMPVLDQYLDNNHLVVSQSIEAIARLEKSKLLSKKAE